VLHNNSLAQPQVTRHSSISLAQPLPWLVRINTQWGRVPPSSATHTPSPGVFYLSHNADACDHMTTLNLDADDSIGSGASDQLRATLRPQLPRGPQVHAAFRSTSRGSARSQSFCPTWS